MTFDWKGIESYGDKHNTYILIDVLVCSIVERIYELRRFVFCQVFLLISHRAGKAKRIKKRSARYRLNSLFFSTK